MSHVGHRCGQYGNGAGGPAKDPEEPCQMILALKPPRREMPPGGNANGDSHMRALSARRRLAKRDLLPNGSVTFPRGDERRVTTGARRYGHARLSHVA